LKHRPKFGRIGKDKGSKKLENGERMTDKEAERLSKMLEKGTKMKDQELALFKKCSNLKQLI